MPNSWQARMMRTAISPRFATRTRPNGLPPGLSLRKDGDISERDVAMLLPWIRVPFVGQHLERPNQSRSRLGRLDHVIDVATAGCNVRVGELRLIRRNQSG